MSVRNLDKLFQPRSVALVGATARPGSVGAAVMRNLCRAGFAGELMLVNPHHREIDGRIVYPDVASLPQAPDLAVVVTPPETVPALIGELGKCGTRAAVITTTGFAELGEPGSALQQAALDAAKPYLLRIVGPNCLGIIGPRLGLDASVSHLAPQPGDIAFLSQSGAMVTAMLDWAVPRGIGFSHVVSLGDMADVDFGDMLDYLAADGHTRAILLYAEDITEGRKFMSAARAASRVKPVLVLKPGRSNVGADAVYDAAFRRAGLLRVGTTAELFDAAETLALTQEQAGDRLAILTNGGGAGVLAADALVAAGGRLAELSKDTLAELNRLSPTNSSRGNPVEIGGGASARRYADALAALIRDPEADAILVISCPTALVQPEEAARATIDTIAAAQPETLRRRNVITAWLGEHSARAARRLFAEARIATYATPDSAVAGFLHRVHHRRNQELLMETPPARSGTFEPDVAAARRTIATALAAGKSWLDGEDVNTILAAYGIPIARPRVARAGAVELFAGLVEDPVFGPLVTFGQGGSAAEIVQDTSLELPPLNALLARRLMARTRVWRFLQAYRGKPAANIAVIAEVLVRLGQLVADHPDVRELDINPLLADSEGIVALDTRLRIAPATKPAAARLAIAPYPQELQSTERLRDGTVLGMRPVRPEDEPMLIDLAAHMSPEDLRFRFFTPVRGLTHAVAARLSQLDYDREMALLAELAGMALGVVRFSADPDRQQAEFAVTVRSDWKGRGLGYLLMTRLIDIASQRGIGELVGEVLHENKPMLQMCRKLGFAIIPQSDDPAVIVVRKSLTENGADQPGVKMARTLTGELGQMGAKPNPMRY